MMVKGMYRITKSFVLLLVALMVLVAAFGTLTPVDAAEGTWIYVDGANGNDSNDGSSAGAAVRTWSKAKELLDTKEGGIYVAGTVAATGNINTKAPGKQSVKRADGFDGVMFEVPAGETATFSNIDVDGENKQIDSAVVSPNSGATVNYLSGAVFHNVGYDGWSQAMPSDLTGGVVSTLSPGVTILIDGAKFENNKGKGIFFAPIVLGQSEGVPNVTVTMKSGRVTGNKGYFYHNELEATNQNLVVYNALIRNNDASSTPARYTNYQGRTGVAYICNFGSMRVRSLDGAAIYDNASYDLMQLGEDGAGIHFQGSSLSEPNHTMLGGGNPQWSSAIDAGNGYYAYKSSPSDADKAAAVEAATSIFEGNQSTLFDSNGVITFGRYSNETPPETPDVPDDSEDDGDNPPSDDDNPPSDDDNPPSDDDDNPPADDDNPPGEPTIPATADEEPEDTENPGDETGEEPDGTDYDGPPDVPIVGTTTTTSTPDSTSASGTTSASSGPAIPHTGDEANVMPWIVLAMVAGASLFATARKAKKN